MHLQPGVKSGQQKQFCRPFEKRHPLSLCSPPKPPPTFLTPLPRPLCELVNGLCPSVNIVFLYQRHIFQPLSKGEEGALREGEVRIERVYVCVCVLGMGAPPLLSPLFSLLLPASSSHIWHCLSPGLLVQAEGKRLEQEHSANLRSTVAALQDKSD